MKDYDEIKSSLEKKPKLKKHPLLREYALLEGQKESKNISLSAKGVEGHKSLKSDNYGKES
ncbi:MAG: hypothetical protein C5B43_02660 [Verrucomicrobia bacterium]|nr:MAG: hypothetical protein C5B43_02660 [Verrucomicrobiota bacterium]